MPYDGLVFLNVLMLAYDGLVLVSWEQRDNEAFLQFVFLNVMPYDGLVLVSREQFDNKAFSAMCF